jgi:hypothetical protein
MQIINKRTIKRRYIIVPMLVLLVAVIAITILEYTNTTHLFHSKPSNTTASPDIKGETASPPGQQTVSPASPSTATSGPIEPSTNNKTDGPIDDNTPLTLSSSELVSAHKVQSDSSIVSVCNTTSGATCTISFTKDGVRKSLQPEVADRGGTAYWNGWRPKDIGLTPGTWSIEATAKLDSQEKTMADALNLEISQ